MARSTRGWGLVVLAVVLYGIPRLLLGPGGGGLTGRRGPAAALLDSPLGLLFEFWWVPLLVAIAVLARDYGLGDQVAIGQFSGTSSRRLSVDRDDIVRATNWSRINRVVFLRSVGISLASAGTVALVLTAVLSVAGDGPGGFATSVLALAVLVGGVAVYLFSRTKGKRIKHDYTHRVSIRIPDLFGPHSFHVHLRQVAEDIGYVVREEVSPGRGGTPAGFDDEIYLSEGGFVARKRPIAPPISPFPDESPVSDLVNLTSASAAAVLVGIALLFTNSEVVGPALGGLFVVLGTVGLLYAYVARTRKWARLYCLVEGTVSTPTANLYTEELDTVETHHLDPTITASQTSTELVVTVGVRASPFFDDDELETEFESFVSDLETVASENCHHVLDGTLSENGTTNVTQSPQQP